MTDEGVVVNGKTAKSREFYNKLKNQISATAKSVKEKHAKMLEDNKKFKVSGKRPPVASKGKRGIPDIFKVGLKKPRHVKA